MATEEGKVSIPFKRESVSKDMSLSSFLTIVRGFNSLQTGKCIQRGLIVCFWSKLNDCFNSLQTGKCIQRLQSHPRLKLPKLPFQFPSNGKVYPKMSRNGNSSHRHGCFNSLQTGKCIQRKLPIPPEMVVWLCFNSLQTGKCIQRWRHKLKIHLKLQRFQFPSNGKVYPKFVRGSLNISASGIVSIPFKRESVSKAFLTVFETD